MKEKRYFCDFWFSIFGSEAKRTASLFFAGIVVLIAFIMTVVCYRSFSTNFGSYSPETYERLNQIADNVIIKGVGIDITAIPDDVESFKIIYGKETIEFEYRLKNNDFESSIVPSKSMTIKLSNDFEIIYKNSTYDSEHKYMFALKSYAWADSFIFGVGITFLVSALFIFCGGIAARISRMHKRHNKLKNLS